MIDLSLTDSSAAGVLAWLPSATAAGPEISWRKTAICF